MSIVYSDGFGQFPQDNATPHASRVAPEWLQEHSSGLRHFHFSPESPDMNIIEDIWMPCYMLFRRDLRHLALLWICGLPCRIQFPPGYLQTLVEFIPRRVVALLRACGGPT
ncbi:hypothetical protein AVEN_132894-1 [Araneus ventricosus]|uniref:Tc1-like transposase DDE domain-containing protein n=1 Tax=Araneus ventricosus TaxID=182803 RepID=A0A4Y2ISV7_ARAVE|nr:hypothetical protein AVEN_132894-1 [Araneus ventricosus]